MEKKCSSISEIFVIWHLLELKLYCFLATPPNYTNIPMVMEQLSITTGFIKQTPWKTSWCFLEIPQISPRCLTLQLSQNSRMQIPPLSSSPYNSEHVVCRLPKSCMQVVPICVKTGSRPWHLSHIGIFVLKENNASTLTHSAAKPTFF